MLPQRSYLMPAGIPWSIQGTCAGLADMMWDLQETCTFELAARGQVRSPGALKGHRRSMFRHMHFF